MPPFTFSFLDPNILLITVFFSTFNTYSFLKSKSQVQFLSRVDHFWKIRARKIRTDVGKFSFVNRTIADWNQLPEGVIGTSTVKTHIFRKRVRKAISREGK
jgi:hypothetical protein